MLSEEAREVRGSTSPTLWITTNCVCNQEENSCYANISNCRPGKSERKSMTTTDGGSDQV